MKTFILLALFSLFFGSTSAQLKIHGRVVDTSGVPIDAASISVMCLNEESGFYFTRTAIDGLFSFLIPDSLRLKTLTIKVNAFGYYPASALYKYPLDSMRIILKSNSVELPPVEVKGRETKIKRSGDTLSYPVKSFSNPTDKVIADIIKKLPGIEIDASGTISYNGIPINNFYIDGDNLLDDRYTIASRALPVDLVDKIQVIENNQHIKALAGLIQTERAAINIVLNDKAKLSWTNNATMGGGVDKLYTGELNSLAFKKRLKTINTLKANNLGNDLSEEISSHLASSGNDHIESQGDVLSTDKITNLVLAKQRWLFNQSKLLTINTMFKISTGTSMRFNGHLFSDKQNQNFSQSTNIIIPNANILYSVSTSLEERLLKGNLSLNFNVNTKKVYLNNTLSYENNNLRSLALTNLDTLPIKQRLSSGKLIVRNSTNGVFVFMGKRVIEFVSDISFSKKPENLLVSPGLFTESVNVGQPYEEFNQRVNMPTFSTTNSFTYRYSFPNILLSSSLGFSYMKQVLNSSLGLTQSGGMITNAADSFFNAFEFSKWRIFLDNDARWKKNNTQIRLALPFQKLFISTYDSSLMPLPQKSILFLFQPLLEIRQTIGKESELTMDYRFNTNYGDITSLYRGNIIQNFRDITYNDITYPESAKSQQSITARYSFRNSLKIFFFNLYTTYQQYSSDFLLTSFVTANSSKSVALPIENRSSLWALGSGISKYLFPLKTTLRVNYKFRYRVSPFLQNGILFNNTNTSNDFFLGFNTKVAKWLFAKYESAYSMLIMQNASSNKKSKVSQFRQSASADIIPNSALSFRFEAENYRVQNGEQFSQSFYFLDFSLKYKLVKPSLDCELLCLNITNNSQFIRNEVYSNSISSSSFSIRPRNLVFRVSFNF